MNMINIKLLYIYSCYKSIDLSFILVELKYRFGNIKLTNTHFNHLSIDF